MIFGRRGAEAQKKSNVLARRMAWVCSVVLLLLPFGANAQDVKVTATLDTANILIGQQAHLELSVTYRVDQHTPKHIKWPTVTDTLTAKVPVLHDSHVDTILPDKQNDPYLFKQTRTLTITAWDSGYWAIPPFTFVIDSDSVSTNALLLTVNTVEVDTARGIRDIKEIYTLPFSFVDWLRDNWTVVAGGTVALAILIALIIFFVGRARRPKAPVPVEPKQPLHVRTLLALEALQQKKLWEEGRTKDYYSELTDILRGYVEERFRVPAMEQTTDELIAALRLSSMPTAPREQLANLLRLADMVKFAKWHPFSSENEQMMVGAIRLVQETADTRPDAPLT